MGVGLRGSAHCVQVQEAKRPAWSELFNAVVDVVLWTISYWQIVTISPESMNYRYAGCPAACNH